MLPAYALLLVLGTKLTQCLTVSQTSLHVFSNASFALIDKGTPRRQSRGKQARSYRFEDEYSFLDDDDASAPSGTQTPNHQAGDFEPEDDFMPDVEEEPEDDFEEEVVESSDSGEGEYEGEDSERDGMETPKVRVAESKPKHSSSLSKGKRVQILDPTPRARVKVPIHITRGGGVSAKAVGATPLRTRGVADFTKVGGQEVRLKDLFGPKTEDLKTVLMTRDFWERQETFPLRNPSTLRHSFFEIPETRDKEVKATRTWYADTGREAFARTQKSRRIAKEDGERYLVNSGPESLNVLLGQVDAPEVYTLEQRSYLNVAEPFKEKKNRRGWLFNLGSRIQDAQWATIEGGSTQYLAVAVEQKPTTCTQPRPMENPKAPAFSAAKPFAASIQIWAFTADSNGWLDSSQQPTLQIVICTDWGAPKQFRWCPISTGDDSSPPDMHEDVYLGLLAGIWSDGRVRILNVSCPKSNIRTLDTHYLHVSQAAFDISLPQTIPSCLHWLSGTTLAVATAIGTLAIWTLSRADTFMPETNMTPRPWYYQRVSETYILTLTSGWPSQPHLLSISTADGFARMYDIRTPNADSTTSIRGRTLCITQDWHEQTQSFIAPDEHYMLKHNPIRRYYHNLYSMRALSSITRCASSPVQPAILIGGADGRVEASNPIGRITNYKIIPWQQTWFAHEWRGPVDKLIAKPPGQDVEMSEGGPVGEIATSEDATAAKANSIPDSFLSQPLARITEGYKATQPGIQHSTSMVKKKELEIAVGITIYEEPSAITALAWNPNLKFGTWAVAGMGDGLLRVEDVGV